MARTPMVLRPGPRAPSLHVYLDGDGTPWFGGLPARDPTPRAPLVLALMARDPDATLYLGRPCYHGLAGAPGCSDRLWTSGRYSEAVVASMAAAVRRIAEAEGVQRVTWFGYSGGGTLAMLLAPRVPETRAVVTVAANIDVAAWVRHHDVRPLDGSLDPAREPPLPPRIVQRHWVGAADPEVPSDVVHPGLCRGFAPIRPRPVLACPRCGGRLRLLGTIEDPVAIRAILDHLAASAEGVDHAHPRQRAKVCGFPWR